MDKFMETIKQNAKGVVAGAVILIGGIAFALGSGGEEKISPETAAVETVKSYEDEFDISLGDLKLCMSKDQLQKIKGKENRMENFSDSKYPYYVYDNMSVIVDDNNLILGLTSHINSPEIKTEKNIHSGSTIDEIFAAYGKDCIFTESGDDEGNDLFQYPFKSKSGKNFAALTFHVYGDRVKSIDWALIGEGIYKDLSQKVSPYAEHVLTRDFDLSVGNVKLGNTIYEVKNLCGNNAQEILGENGKFDLKYPDMKISFENDVVVGIVTYTGNVETEKNIRQGSNIDEIFAAYGDTCAVSNYDGLTLTEYLFDSSNGRTAVMRFALNNSGIADYISLRLIDEGEKQNLLKVTKNFKQELLNEKQKAEEAARLEAERQAEIQRQSQPREILAHTTQTPVEFTQHYLLRGSAVKTDYGIKAQFHEIGSIRNKQFDKYEWHTFIQWNGAWYFGPDAETWENWSNEYRIKYLQVMENDPMHGFEDMLNAAYQDLNNR